eukprot:210946_1
MSASVVDHRFQNWFMNSKPEQNDQLTTYNSTNNTYTTTTNTSTTSNINTSRSTMPSTHSSINFDPSHNANNHFHSHSPLIPKPGPPPSNERSPSPPPNNNNHAHNNNGSPSPPLPQSKTTNSSLSNINILNNILNNNCSTPSPLDECSYLPHLINNMANVIQSMNQYIDSHRSNNNRDVIVTKTTNCRNELVSCLSFYQTFISGHNSCSSCSSALDHTHHSSNHDHMNPYLVDEYEASQSISFNNTTTNHKQREHDNILSDSSTPKAIQHITAAVTTPSSYCNPLKQGLEFPRMAYGGCMDNSSSSSTTSNSTTSNNTSSHNPHQHHQQHNNNKNDINNHHDADSDGKLT